MSDVQSAKPSTPDVTDNSTQDRGLRVRQLTVWGLSIILAVVITALLQTFVLKVGLWVTFPMSSWEVPLLIAASIPMTFILLIWLDYFMGTKILPD